MPFRMIPSVRHWTIEVHYSYYITDKTRVPVTEPSKTTHSTTHSGSCVLTKDSLRGEINTDTMSESDPVGWVEKEGSLLKSTTSPRELVYINDEIDMGIPVFVSPCKFWLVFFSFYWVGSERFQFSFVP